MISVFPSVHVNLKVMHRSLEPKFREPNKSCYSVWRSSNAGKNVFLKHSLGLH